MRETQYSQKLYKAIRKLNIDKEEKGQLLVCLYINGCSSEDCAKLFGADEQKVVNFLQSEEIYGYQVCTKCNILKDKVNDFSQFKNGKNLICKECRNENSHKYYNDYYQRNKEHKKQYSKQYYQKNNERKKQQHKEYKTSDASIEHVQKLAMYEKVSGNQICCKYCGKWMTPTTRQVNSRLRGINTNDTHYIYCSEECKQECPAYYQILYPKSFKPASSREVNPVLRQIVLERDDYTCQKCHKSQDELTVGLHCHHITPAVNSPMEADDPDTCTTLCKDCHKIVHKIPGCGYHELRCD